MQGKNTPKKSAAKKNTKNQKAFEFSTPMMAGLLAVFLIVSFLYEFVLTGRDEQDAAASAQPADWGVRINEVMSANASALVSDTGKYSDWLEIYHGGYLPVNLRGWTLSKADDAIHPLTFPDYTLLPGDYLIIYADGKAQTAAGYAFHAPWKLTAAGDTVILADASGNVVSAVNTPSLEKNEVYSFTASSEWESTRQYTPGMPNTAESYQLLMDGRQMPEDAIEISEVMIKNRTYAPDEDGEFCDYIELHNTSDRAVSLKGYALSDTDANLGKYILPDATVEAGGYFLVYASGKDRAGSAVHTGFKLGDDESVFLANAKGQMIDCVTPETTEADQAWSRRDGGFTAMFAPTPGQPNTDAGVAAIDAQLTAGNIHGIYISEVMTSTNETELSSGSHDWVEIYNSTGGMLDLSGIALSDDANRPRKWQFPNGSTINAGEYKIIFLTGEEGMEDGTHCASFRLSKDGGYSLLLSTPEGKLIDRVPVGEQFANVSFGRSYSVAGFQYYTAPTPKAANNGSGYAGRAAEAVFSQEGGLYKAGETVTVTLSAPAGATIYYTTDCSDPDQTSPVYTGPITMNSNTILRTLVHENGKLPSLISTQSYFFGMDHTVRVVSLVSDPVNLFDYYEGIYEKGPGAVGQYAEHPYGSNNKGANFWMDWEKMAHVEVFTETGETMISQGCGLKLQGQFSRAEAQKSFKLIARSEYGPNRFRAEIFEDRPYTEYQSFVLRASGQDWDKTRMRDVVQTSLASETEVMYQAAEMCVVYINGQYWGHYNMRERINEYSIAQWENWSSDVDAMDVIKANRTVMQGSNDSFEEIAVWVDDHGVKTQEDIDYVARSVDIENYLDYVAVQIYVGNPDLLNVKRYRSVEEDGKWRWVLFDTDWGYTTDTNSMRRWLDPRGAGSEYKTDNRLFVGLMANDSIRDQFLHRFDELMLKSWTADKVLATIDKYARILEPEIDQHLERWGFTRAKYDREMKIFREYAEERPLKMLYYIKDTYEMNESTMMSYFSDSLPVVVKQAIDDIVAKIDASGRSKWLKDVRLDEDEYSKKLEKLYEYAEEHPALLLKPIYEVYKSNGDAGAHDLKAFKDVLDQAK